MSIQPLSIANSNAINHIHFGNQVTPSNQTTNTGYTTQPYPQDSVEINGKKKRIV